MLVRWWGWLLARVWPALVLVPELGFLAGCGTVSPRCESKLLASKGVSVQWLHTRWTQRYLQYSLFRVTYLSPQIMRVMALMTYFVFFFGIVFFAAFVALGAFGSYFQTFFCNYDSQKAFSSLKKAEIFIPSFRSPIWGIVNKKFGRSGAEIPMKRVYWE